jgi:hypothetical protein
VSDSLLESVRGLIERTYRIHSGLTEIGSFVIGDQGFRRLYRSSRDGHDIGSADGQGARTLVRETDRGVVACIYFPDAMIRQLEAYPPQRGVREENQAAFSTFVEEIDHLLVLAERSLRARAVSLFELELHANVSKYLVLARFLAGCSQHLRADRRLWLRRRLFDDVRFCDDDCEVRRRYRDAARAAVQLIEGLGALDPAERIAALRRFHSVGVADKLRLISEIGRGRV